MSLTVQMALFTCAMTLIVFVAVLRVRGLVWALAAGGLAFAGMSALGVGLVMFIVSRM